MIRPRWWLVVPALLASAVVQAASAAEIRDKAGMFSPDAVKKAQVDLDRLQKEFDVPVTVETIESLDGEKINTVFDRRTQAVGGEGVYILIPRQDHKILAEASKHYRQYLTRSRMESVQDAFLNRFKEGDFNGGLGQGVAKLGSVFTDAKADAGGTIRQNSPPNAKRGATPVPARRNPGAKPSSGGFPLLLTIIIGVLAFLFVVRLLGGLFRGMRGNQQSYGGGMMGGRGGYPGPGGPGYGGGYGGAPAGGGGFMSSLFGGIGGAMAGNWLYDQFSGRQHGGYTDQAGYDQGAAAPVEDAGPEWSSGNDAAGDWGGDTATTDAPAGDWGGGGGNDWGGGDAGGDWGGGGGDDNAGSW